ANPIACILSFAMALRYSFALGAEADMLEQAVERVLAKGLRTPDLMTVGGGTRIGTREMGDAILAELSGV
uniref:isocitrate/isopropylmalate family dehydrogenase n=1 Tax=Rubrimonas sp. TaxID=2036015 RepID=UPI002FDCA8D2